MLSTVLDLAGSLLLILAVVVLIWAVTIPGALAAGGALVLALSWVTDRRTP